MTNILISIFLATLFSTPVDHDAVIALFQISEKGDHYVLDLTFDKKDFLSAKKLDEKEVSQDVVETYLSQTTSWELNGQKAEWKVENLRKDSDHFMVSCSMQKLDQKIQKIEIKNTFLINVHAHSNIIMIDLNEQFRDFRMHRNRTKLEITYKN